MKRYIFLLYTLLLGSFMYANPDVQAEEYILGGDTFVVTGTTTQGFFTSHHNPSSANIIPYRTKKRSLLEITDGKKEEKREDEATSLTEDSKNGGFVTAFFYASLWESLHQHIELFRLNHCFHKTSYRKHILLELFRI